MKALLASGVICAILAFTAGATIDGDGNYDLISAHNDWSYFKLTEWDNDGFGNSTLDSAYTVGMYQRVLAAADFDGISPDIDFRTTPLDFSVLINTGSVKNCGWSYNSFRILTVFSCEIFKTCGGEYMKAIWKGVILAESDRTITVEGNHYFPPECVKKEYLRPSDTQSICPWKGMASYSTVVVGGVENRDAAWYYPHPKEGARQIKEYIAFWKGVQILP